VSPTFSVLGETETDRQTDGQIDTDVAILKHSINNGYDPYM